ncbi:A24 family peptidase [Halobacillus seohaensis]|uniref:Prepilin peptidase n=1 Tax=Halobacillus seohaensis TaxID=447421 RepID=A0ABW2ESE9_9BACI
MILTILTIVLIICFITDIRSRKIYNVITLPAVLLGLIIHTIINGWQGLLFSGSGLLVGGGLLFILFVFGAMGAGDVKLLAAIGSLMGTNFVFYTFIYAALIGGLVAFVLLFRKKKLSGFFQQIFFSIFIFKGERGSLSVSQQPGSETFPYGVAIVLGTVCSYFMEGSL